MLGGNGMLNKLVTTAVFLLIALGSRPLHIVAQTPLATFKSNVDLVRVSAIVRDRKGRFVQDLSARDFEILDARDGAGAESKHQSPVHRALSSPYRLPPTAAVHPLRPLEC